MKINYDTFQKMAKNVLSPEISIDNENWIRRHRAFCNYFYNVYHFQKAKKIREVQAPRDNLKLAQQYLVTFFSKYSLHPSVYGMDRKDYLQNALAHKDKKELFVLDLKNFYKECTFQRINRSIKDPCLKKDIEKYAELLFYVEPQMDSPNEMYLCTGAPTSPIIANLAVTEMDYSLQELADRYKATYTRYLDDITFSFEESLSHDTKIEFSQYVISIVEQDEWPINWQKTKWLNPVNDAIVVTGVDLRNSPKVTRKYIVNCIRPGLDNIAKSLLQYNGFLTGSTCRFPNINSILKLINSISNEVSGKLTYIKYVNPDQYDSLVEYFHKRIKVHFRYTFNLSDLNDPINFKKVCDLLIHQMFKTDSHRDSELIDNTLVIPELEKLKDTDLKGYSLIVAAVSNAVFSYKKQFKVDAIRPNEGFLALEKYTYAKLRQEAVSSLSEEDVETTIVS